MGLKHDTNNGSAVEPMQEVTTHGAVFYADAGVRPVNPGFGGWGFHGYVYSNTQPKKSMGPLSLAVTSSGYVPKSDKPTEVTPIRYLDGFGTIPYASNNGAEVLAAAHAIDCALRWEIKNITVKTDSRYVITGATDYLPRWKVSEWKKADGQQISNLEHWQLLDKKLCDLQARGCAIRFEWVKGHNGDQGNEMADKYATIGALASGAGQSKAMTQIAEAGEYWKEEEESHPFIAQRTMYMVTSPQSINKGEYYLGNHGKDDDLLGKRMADGSYSYVQLDQPDPYLELLIGKQLKVSNTEDSIVLVRLDELLKPKVRKDLMLFGDEMLIPTSPKRNRAQDLKLVGGSDDEPISVKLNPPLIAMRAVESVNFLKGLFLAWKENRLEGVATTDITSCFFEDDKKSGKKILSTFTQAVSAVAVKAKIHPHDDVQIDLELIVNIDIPSRNVFKRIEKLNPKITLLVWKDSDKAYRYATIIEANGGKAIWCGYYTNYKYIFQTPEQLTVQTEVVQISTAKDQPSQAETEVKLASRKKLSVKSKSQEAAVTA